MSLYQNASSVAVPRLSVRTKTLAALVAVVAAVALPQIFHQAGAALGVGAALGKTLLPMHLPIILVGLLAGPGAGAVAGAFGPIVSFALSGMPAATALPFMVIELAAYGLCAGLLREVRVPAPAKIVAAQLAGRVVLTAATAVAIAAFGAEQSVVAIWTTTLAAGLPGLVLQWVSLPVIVAIVERISAAERGDE